MENEYPKYLLYFNLQGNQSYDKTEFKTIDKFIKNLIDNKYYQLDLNIFFNEEIKNYDVIKKELSDDIMLLMGQIDDDLVDDIVFDITSILGIDKVIRRRSVYDFNSTGYSDEQLISKYNDYLKETKSIEINSNENDNKYQNIAYLQQNNYLEFCEFLIQNKDLDSFSYLQEFNVLEALFANFPYFLKYIMTWKIKELIIYYNKDVIKILRNIRTYVRQSEDYNDNVKELFIYKLILNNFFDKTEFYYDAEEGFDKIKNEFEDLIRAYNQKLINEFNQKFKLFKGEYRIISMADPKRKKFQEYDKIANSINKHFDKLKPLLKSFRSIENNFVKFNSKKKYPERIKTMLDQFKQSRIITEYQEKFGLYSITLESNEHIPYLQGKWFEYYTARVCNDIINELRRKGYNPDFKIFQNILVNIDGSKRELDVIVFLNGHLFYIENKIDSKNTFKSDIEKYRINSQHMNVSKNNCYLVYLEGEDKQHDSIRFLSMKAFKNKFLRESLKILEADKKIEAEIKMAAQKVERERESKQKALIKTKTTLYLRHHIDYEAEEKRIRRTIQKYENEIIKITFPEKTKFFLETLTQIEESGNINLKNKFLEFKDRYEADYLSKLAFSKPDKNFFDRIATELKVINEDGVLDNACEKLYCLAGNIEAFFELGKINIEKKLLVLCGYGNRHDNYLGFIQKFLSFSYIYSIDRSCYLLVHYLNSIVDDNVRDSIVIANFIQMLMKYLTTVETILTNRITKLKNNVSQIRKEKEFIGVFINAFMHKHFNEFSLYGLVFSNIDTFIYRISTNQMIYKKSVEKSELGKFLLAYNPKKTAFFETKYQEVSEYLFKNFDELKINIKNMIDTDERMIFEVPRNKIVNKALKLLKKSGIIADYKTVENADVYVGIFTNYQAYYWFENYSWVGTYLCNRYDSDPLYTNVDLKYQEQNCKLLFLKEIGRSVNYCLAKFIDDDMHFAAGIISKTRLKDALEALRDSDFNLNIADLIYVCDKKILKKVQ